MDPLKEAFQKIKEEMILLKTEITNLKEEVFSLKQLATANNFSANTTQTSTQPLNPTDTPAQTSAVPQEIRGFQITNYNLSTGNKGVPTDSSTDRQTVQQTDRQPSYLSQNTIENSVKIHETLSNLDNLKREIRLKFKRLTNQEMLIFSTLYSLESQGFEEITYKVLANNLNLSESSIRDYVAKLVVKGIPIAKTRLNNKQISLNISPDLQKLASLATITRLREL